MVKRSKAVIVTGVLNDIHHLGIWFVEKMLEREGYKVVRLGTMLLQEDFIKAAIETAADAVFVSCSNGHAEFECQGLRDKFIEAGLPNILLYLGGALSVQPKPWPELEAIFLNMDFNRVFPQGIRIEDVIKILEEDLQNRKRGGN